jgi:hypothetical protein
MERPVRGGECVSYKRDIRIAHQKMDATHMEFMTPLEEVVMCFSVKSVRYISDKGRVFFGCVRRV